MPPAPERSTIASGVRPIGRVKTIKSVIDMADYSPPPRGTNGQNAKRRPAAAARDRVTSPSPHRSGGSGQPEPGWHQAQRAAPFQRQAFAAIDLGTNNCRLLIARPQGDSFVVVDAFSRVVRLGEGLAQTGRLSDAAMDRALSALSVCADKLVRRNVHMARSVATEACRRARNARDFMRQVKRETGLHVEIIPAEEEARRLVARMLARELAQRLRERMLAGEFDEDVEFAGAVLQKIARAFVALKHVLTELLVVVLAQRLFAGDDAVMSQGPGKHSSYPPATATAAPITTCARN